MLFSIHRDTWQYHTRLHKNREYVDMLHTVHLDTCMHVFVACFALCFAHEANKHVSSI